LPLEQSKRKENSKKVGKNPKNVDKSRQNPIMRTDFGRSVPVSGRCFLELFNHEGGAEK
jgi:hypothetical protein